MVVVPVGHSLESEARVHTGRGWGLTGRAKRVPTPPPRSRLGRVHPFATPVKRGPKRKLDLVLTEQDTGYCLLPSSTPPAPLEGGEGPGRRPSGTPSRSRGVDVYDDRPTHHRGLSSKELPVKFRRMLFL